MIVLPLLPFYALELQAPRREMVGLLIASFSIAQLVAAPLWGRVSDRYGRRPALLIGLTASAVAYVVFGFAESLWLLLLSRLVQGAGGGTTGVAQAYVADTIAPADRARALGWLSAATSAGVVLGPAIGSFAAHFGKAAPGLVAAALCLSTSSSPGAGCPSRRPATTVRRGRGHRCGTRPGPRSATPAAGSPGCSGSTASGCSPSPRRPRRCALSRRGVRAQRADHRPDLHLHRCALVHDAEPAARARSWTGSASLRTMRIGTVLLVLGLVLYPVPRDLWALAVVIPLVPIGTALLFPSTTSLMSRHSDPRELGATMGVAQTFAGLARVAAPLLATAAFQRLGHAWPFYLAGGCVALVGLLAFRVRGQPERPPRRRRRRRRGLMSADDRLERLEQRVAVLETLVRQASPQRVGGARRSRARGAFPPSSPRRRRSADAPVSVATPRPRHRRPRRRSDQRPVGPPAASATAPPVRRLDARFHRTVDRPARAPRHRRVRAADGARVSAQAELRARLDPADGALHRRRAGRARWSERSGGGCTSATGPTARRSSAVGRG